MAAHPSCPARSFYDPLKNRSGGWWESKRKGVFSSSDLFLRRRAFVTWYDPPSAKAFSPCYLSRCGKEERIMSPAPSNMYRRISVFVTERGVDRQCPPPFLFYHPPPLLSHNDVNWLLFLIVSSPLHWKFCRIIGVFTLPWCPSVAKTRTQGSWLDVYEEISDISFMNYTAMGPSPLWGWTRGNVIHQNFWDTFETGGDDRLEWKWELNAFPLRFLLLGRICGEGRIHIETCIPPWGFMSNGSDLEHFDVIAFH